METYTNLFSQIRIGNMLVKNRVFMAPMSTHLANNRGEVTEELIAYYKTRAEGGVGFITIPSILIEKLSRYGTYRNLCLYEDWHIGNLEKLTKAIHESGAKIGAQILHPSTACSPEYNEGRIPVAASSVQSGAYIIVPRALEVDEIHEYVDKFAKAALRAKLAGFDAVEIHCCHRHGLLGNFISPLHNKRIDEYGGTIKGRLKFPLEVIKKVKKYVGEDYPIIVRMSATDEEPGGQSIMEGCYIAKAFEAAGASMINLSNGTLDAPWKTTAPAGAPQGLNADFAATIKKSISIPLGVVGRINEPWVGELLLERGACDVCYVGRALICDPEFVNKTALGEESNIRPCIGCLQCLLAANTDQQFECTINPNAAHEIKKKKPMLIQKKILVVGGGPGGLTAARCAAEKGHNVTLIDKSDRLGGQMYLAAIPPCKQDIAKAAAYMIKELKDLAVTVKLGTEMRASEIKNEKFDLVILALGDDAIVPEFMSEADCAITAREALDASKPVGRNVVIIGGGSVGCETADYLINPHYNLNPLGRRVTVIEMAETMAATEKTSARSLLMERLIKKGCELLTGCNVVSVKGSQIVYNDGVSDYMIDNVDTVIAAIGSKRDTSLQEELSKTSVPFAVIDNCATMKSSIRQAYDTVENLL